MLCFAVGQLAIDPDSQLLKIHPLIEIVVDHVANNPSNALVVVILYHLQSLGHYIVEDIVVAGIETFTARQ